MGKVGYFVFRAFEYLSEYRFLIFIYDFVCLFFFAVLLFWLYFSVFVFRHFFHFIFTCAYPIRDDTVFIDFFALSRSRIVVESVRGVLGTKVG